MKVLIAGGGIGGLAAALALHEVGIDVEIFEQAPNIRELGVGINVLPHATKELAKLGLLSALDDAGIRTRELIYMNRLGQTVWQELRGMDAGYDTPQYSIHRGKLLGVLHEAVHSRLGSSCIHTGCKLVGFDDRGEHVVARFNDHKDGAQIEAVGDVLVGADGIHSTLRSLLYPGEGPSIWSGIMIWRGATSWPAYRDGRTMVIAGGNEAKFVFYPIEAKITVPETCLTNWAVMARISGGAGPRVRPEDWRREGRLDEVLPIIRGRFRLNFVDPAAIIEATENFYEYPNCDRDPLPRWSFGRVTLLGDAAHPMYPNGSNGAGQAILDAISLARHLGSTLPVDTALHAYESERLPATARIVHSNRKGGPEGIIDLVESRAPHGFDNIENVATYAEREAIVCGYASLAGYAKKQVNVSASALRKLE